MTRAKKKSFRLELTKEQQALILQNTGMEAKELELTDVEESANRAQAPGQSALKCSDLETIAGVQTSVPTFPAHPSHF